MNTETTATEDATDVRDYQIGPDSEDMREVDGENNQIEKTLEITEAENRLIELENAERDCQSAKSDWNSCKEDAKYAKARYDQKVDRLRSLARANANDSDRPLLPENQKTAEPEGWLEVSIDVLWGSEFKGLGDSKKEALVDEVVTLGGLEKIRCKVGKEEDHLCKLLPDGLARSLLTSLKTVIWNTSLTFLTKRLIRISKATLPTESRN